jgi:hypothetical protein
MVIRYMNPPSYRTKCKKAAHPKMCRFELNRQSPSRKIIHAPN